LKAQIVLWVTFWLAQRPYLPRPQYRAGRHKAFSEVFFVSGEFMSERIVSICENDNLRSRTVNAVDALDGEIDAVWGLIAIIEVLERESRDNNYASGALRVAHNHLSALIAIRDGLK
jgi:hypothetical protein